MKTKSDTKIQAVQEYYRVSEQIKTLEKAKEALKLDIKIAMGTQTVLEAGDYVVIRDTASRTDADREALKSAGLWEKYCKESTYEKLTVKKAA